MNARHAVRGGRTSNYCPDRWEEVQRDLAAGLPWRASWLIYDFSAVSSLVEGTHRLSVVIKRRGEACLPPTASLRAADDRLGSLIIVERDAAAAAAAGENQSTPT